MQKTVEQRFWEKVDIRGPDECWPWLMRKDKDGYGRFTVTSSKHVLAHRFAYELVNGPIPARLGVLHKCDFPACCNPGHFFTGTGLDNQEDSISKGRRAPQDGELNGNAKLTQDKVREIRRLYAAGHNQCEIGRTMGVTHQAIWRIVHDVAWCNVESAKSASR